MSDLVRWSIAVTLVLLVPVIPFIGFGDSLDQRVEQWFDASLSPAATAAVVAAVLASDVLLPVPSSFVSTLAGSRLGVPAGTAVIWLGMTVGAVVGFGLARLCGRPLATRLSAPHDLRRMEALAARGGPTVLVLTRALPVLAEASVLLMGAIGLSWRRFLPVVMLANLGLAVAYAALGHYARQEGSLAVALAASIAIPVLATMVARRWLPAASA
ncbi:MAG: VTT domain-containing protein [Planctomycetia bacterium]|nr:VTT domain-containing protein [Planctomycetia bacterium]